MYMNTTEAVDMNGRFQMQGGKNWFLPKEMNANRFFWESHWLEIWSNHFYPSMGPNGGSVAMDSEPCSLQTSTNHLHHTVRKHTFFPQYSSLKELSHKTGSDYA
jgi:hypothetical protein